MSFANSGSNNVGILCLTESFRVLVESNKVYVEEKEHQTVLCTEYIKEMIRRMFYRFSIPTRKHFCVRSARFQPVFGGWFRLLAFFLFRTFCLLRPVSSDYRSQKYNRE